MMKQMTVSGKRPGQIVRFALALGLLALFNGCIARREALNANTTSVSLSQTAAQNLTKLKESQEAEVKAHLVTREACRKLFADWRKARLEAARTQMNADYQGKLAEINEGAANLLVGLHEYRMDKHDTVGAEITRAAQPLEDRIKTLTNAWHEAANKLREHPLDKGRQDEFEKANTNLLAVYISNLSIKLKAVVRAINEMDAVEKDAIEKIQTLAKDHREKVQARYSKALGELPTDSETLPDFGPDPAVNEAVFAGLIKYAEAVQEAAEANRDYLISNSFGTGSFFNDFLKSLGKGVLGGVFNPGSVKGIDAEVLKASFKDVAGVVATDFKAEAGDASATFKKEGANFLEGIKSGLADKITASINSTFNNLAK